MLTKSLRPAPRALIALQLALLGAACTEAGAQLDFSTPPDPSVPAGRPAGSAGPGTSGPTPGAPGTTPGTPGTTPGAPGGTAGGEPTAASLLPARVRRLSNFEYDRTVAVLFGTQAAPAKSFAADFRQSDFTANAAQQVDSTYATQLQGAAQALAKESLTKLISGAGCSPSAGESCAQTFIASFGQQAYRRPLTDEEKAGLLAVFRAGAKGATFNDGIENVVTAMLQSPNFLYVTELGGAPRSGVVTLTPWEIAAQLSYTLTGGPPDRELYAAAMSGALTTAAQREAHARRLLTQPAARAQVARLIKEWLGIDRLEGTGKDKSVYPKYDDLRPSMVAEADAFLAEALFVDDGTLTKVLTADYTVADQKLAQFYGLPSGAAGKRISYGASVPRRGLLMQSAFLSVQASDHDSGPVKRGNTILKKVLGVVLPQPGELNLMVMPPPPDKSKTTRERFAQHSTDPACAGCHRMIDSYGFALENFDGIGAQRTTENNKPVNTTVELAGGDLSGTAKDGLELMAKLAASDAVKASFARNLFRFAGAQSGTGYEEMFMKSVWEKLPAARRVDVKEMLVAFAASDMFVSRRVP